MIYKFPYAWRSQDGKTEGQGVARINSRGKVKAAKQAFSRLNSEMSQKVGGPIWLGLIETQKR